VKFASSSITRETCEVSGRRDELSVVFSLAWWCNSNGPDWWPKGPRIDSEPAHCQVTTLGKLFTHMCLCSPSTIIWYWSKGSAAGKVTIGLASHWPCVMNSSGLFTCGLNSHRKGDEHPAYAPDGARPGFPPTWPSIKYDCWGKLVFPDTKMLVSSYQNGFQLLELAPILCGCSLMVQISHNLLD